MPPSAKKFALRNYATSRILPVDQDVRRHNDVLGISTDVNLIIFIERFLTIIKFS